MEPKITLFNKFSLSWEVLKYLTFADTSIYFLNRLCTQSHEMIKKKWHLITKMVDKREVVLCDKAQFDSLININIVLFRLTINYWDKSQLTLKDVNYFADKLVALFKEHTKNLINSELKINIDESDYLKYFSVEINSISKRYETINKERKMFHFDKTEDLMEIDVIAKLSRIDKDLISGFLNKLKFYSFHSYYSPPI